MIGTAKAPILTIPNEAEGSADFTQRVAILLQSETTHIYIDTSFLMWMTKIGSESRRELTDWLQHNCPERVHVPIWSAHEYLKHHVAETIVQELSEKTKEVQRLAGRTYSYFRPFIDEPLGEGADDPTAIRSEARVTLNTLNRLTEKIGKWNKSYNKHATEVITFINTNTPQQTSVYEHLENITQIGNNRFSGSVPPGFKDRWKKGNDERRSQGEDETLTNSNRYGDLVFWNEILIHAKAAKAKALIIVTNDRKNDWFMGGRNVGNVDAALRALRRNWRSVPRAHPMLVMEAKLVAKVERVELLDSAYLAVLLRDVAEPEVRAFADVAIVSDGILPARPSDQQSKLVVAEPAPSVAGHSTVPIERHFLFSDSEKVISTKAQFQRALFESRNRIVPECEAILQTWRSSVAEKRPLLETMTAELLHEHDHKALVLLAREIHDRVLHPVPGYTEAVADLASMLSELPPNTAASFYLGLLASMYLVRETNSSRIPPCSPVAEFLFAQQSADYAVNGIYVVAKRLLDNESKPLYLPDGNRPTVKVVFDVEPETDMLDQLSSVTVTGTELLTPAQDDELLKLRTIFPEKRTIDSDEILRKACELFAIPYDQVKPEKTVEQGYRLTENIGFRRPRDVTIPKGYADGE